MTEDDFKDLVERAEPEHKAWLQAIVADILSDNAYVSVQAKRMLGTYLGIIGKNKSAKGRRVDVDFS